MVVWEQTYRGTELYPDFVHFMLWGLWILLHSQNVFIFCFIRQLPSNSALGWQPNLSSVFYFCCCYLFYFLLCWSHFYACVLQASSDQSETGMESLYRSGALSLSRSLLLPPPLPVAVVDMNFVLWFFRPERLRPSYQCCADCGCSQDQSHKKW